MYANIIASDARFRAGFMTEMVDSRRFVSIEVPF